MVTNNIYHLEKNTFLFQNNFFSFWEETKQNKTKMSWVIPVGPQFNHKRPDKRVDRAFVPEGKKVMWQKQNQWEDTRL